MIKTFLVNLLNFIKSHAQLQIENAYLHKQIEILIRSKNKVKLRKSDKIFMTIIMKLLSNWKKNLFVVKPETVIKWHRQGFKLFWKWKSRNNSGRPKIDPRIRALIHQLAKENPLWGAPRIHGELMKLGYFVSEATVYRYMPKRRDRDRVVRWKSFLKNHAKEIISMDFFTIPTINFKILYVLLIIEHHRRRILHFNVASNPNSSWTIQQIRNALPSDIVPKYLIRDRDSKFSHDVSSCIKNMCIQEIVTAYRSPWQNGYVERVIGSIRRECLDYFIILNENHLRKVLKAYFIYYTKYRTHLGLDKDSPEGRSVESIGIIQTEPILNGLHHRYYRKAA